MNSKERTKLTFSHQEPDRVPVDYVANADIDSRLKKHFDLASDDHEGLLQALNVDFRSIAAPYAGPELHAQIPDRHIDMWGIHMRWAAHESGGYWDFCDFPLKGADLKTVENWKVPSPDDFDYSAVAKQCKLYKDYFLIIGDPGTGDIINSTGMIFSMEETLINLMIDDDACLRWIDQKCEIQLEMIRRSLEIADGAIDMLFIGEDLGTQIAPIISPELFKKHIRPRHQKFVDLGKEYNLPVMIHSCGSSSWAYNDFIEMGINVVDTLQPEATNMSPKYLKETYGDKLAFHGSISTAGPVAYGSVQDTIDIARETLEIMMPGGGYAFAPTHALQDNSPTENVVAMYEAAIKYGRY